MFHCLAIIFIFISVYIFSVSVFSYLSIYVYIYIIISNTSQATKHVDRQHKIYNNVPMLYILYVK